MAVHEPLLKHFSYPRSQGTKHLMTLFFFFFYDTWITVRHVNHARPWCGWEPFLLRLIWFTAFLSLPALVPGKPLQLGNGKRRAALVTWLSFVREIIVFRFLALHNFSLQPHHHPPTHPPIHPSSLSETRRSQRYQRVSFHESHHQRQLPGFHGNSPLQGR